VFTGGAIVFTYLLSLFQTKPTVHDPEAAIAELTAKIRRPLAFRLRRLIAL
jgi:hypothetical protein